MAELIAEYKRWSPWDGLLTTTPIEQAIQQMEERHDPAMFSILVDPLWGGSPRDLLRAGRVTRKPLLAKGLDPDPFGCPGATWHLTMEPSAVAPETALVECRSMAQIDRAVEAGHSRVLVNRRDLRTGELSDQLDGVAPSMLMEMAQRRHHPLTIVAASGYGSVDEAPAAADYVLIGTALMDETPGGNRG